MPSASRGAGWAQYKITSKAGSGTFSEVLKAQSIKSGAYVAIKCMKAQFKSVEQVNNLREIQSLRRLQPHPNCVRLEEVLYDQPSGRLALVFELLSMNLYELIRGRKKHLSASLIKIYLWQALRALAHMHARGIFHRDIKPENILIEDSYDVYEGLKLADFGSCRGIGSKQPYTEYISTRWYRAPECLLTDGYYGAEMDVFAMACVAFEIASLFPLFPGDNEKDQVAKIHKILGTPNEDVTAFLRRHRSRHMKFDWAPQKGSGFKHWLKHMPAEFGDLLEGMLDYDPRKRITAAQALQHPYFDDLRATPVPPAIQQMESTFEQTPGTAGASSTTGGSSSAAAHSKAKESSTAATTTSTTGSSAAAHGGSARASSKPAAHTKVPEPAAASASKRAESAGSVNSAYSADFEAEGGQPDSSPTASLGTSVQARSVDKHSGSSMAHASPSSSLLQMAGPGLSTRKAHGKMGSKSAKKQQAARSSRPSHSKQSTSTAASGSTRTKAGDNAELARRHREIVRRARHQHSSLVPELAPLSMKASHGALRQEGSSFGGGSGVLARRQAAAALSGMSASGSSATGGASLSRLAGNGNMRPHASLSVLPAADVVQSRAAKHHMASTSALHGGGAARRFGAGQGMSTAGSGSSAMTNSSAMRFAAGGGAARDAGSYLRSSGGHSSHGTGGVSPAAASHMNMGRSMGYGASTGAAAVRYGAAAAAGSGGLRSSAGLGPIKGSNWSHKHRSGAAGYNSSASRFTGYGGYMR